MEAVMKEDLGLQIKEQSHKEGIFRIVLETVEGQSEDLPLDMVPYTDSEGNIYDYGFGLSY